MPRGRGRPPKGDDVRLRGFTVQLEPLHRAQLKRIVRLLPERNALGLKTNEGALVRSMIEREIARYEKLWELSPLPGVGAKPSVGAEDDVPGVGAVTHPETYDIT